MRNIFSVFTLLFFIGGFAQSKLDFAVTDHNFGDIQEEGGPAEFTFHFVNTGNEPVKITNVKASCGCTTPGWTREEVMPGDSGYVKAKYNPRNRPGRFRKSLRLTTTDASSNRTLYISGFVKPKPKTPEEEFPISAGDLRLKYRGLNMGKITTEKPIAKTFDVFNYSDTTVVLSPGAMTLPEHIQVELVQEFLNPREVGQIKVVYDPNKKADYGFVSDNIKLNSRSEENLSVMAVIEEYFPEMTAEELDNAAKLNISERSYDFGKVTAGVVLEKEFELMNDGNDKLELRAVKSNCGCITYDLKKKGIKKGKSQTLTVFFDTSEMRGNQYKSITIYSNDPVAPTQIITLKGKVEKADN
ncbi:Protein of unknown function [Ekhidna lutea]|uniref:DUF1573 domain-containing protein n=1 Tax=Ekhidna lutea TaxID=447679 RepID=A0A239M9Z4_EKHLU|nr:DUF1573 domain-containing protein [Ekhidna lutea]SNT38659.1 Protein of unknown function [Ekhidna lutea]